MSDEINKGTDLSNKMRAIAAKGHPKAAALIKAADEFDENTRGQMATPQTCEIKKFMGSWARARRLYCEVTGESLI